MAVGHGDAEADTADAGEIGQIIADIGNLAEVEFELCRQFLQCCELVVATLEYNDECRDLRHGVPPVPIHAP